MISCHDAVRLLWEYLDDTAATEERVLVEAHLARCRTCCGELEFARELRHMIAQRSADDLPADLMRRLDRTIEDLGT